MGMVIFEESGTFNPADWGLQVGDMLQVICVGGGAGGVVVVFPYGGTNWSVAEGTAGGTSSFGSYISAEGANTDVSSPNGMSKGGKGEWSRSPGSDSDTRYAYPAGGAGGFLPGAPVFGGDGGNAAIYGFDAASWVPVNAHAPTGLGGKGYWGAKTEYQCESFVDLPFANLKGGANGNKGATCGSEKLAAAGNGYGAGGAGGSDISRGSSGGTPNKYANGGNSGEMKIGAVKLGNTAGIAVTVGTGGAGGTITYRDGYSSDTTATTTAGKGAPGVVIVTW